MNEVTRTGIFILIAFFFGALTQGVGNNAYKPTEIEAPAQIIPNKNIIVPKGSNCIYDKNGSLIEVEKDQNAEREAETARIGEQFEKSKREWIAKNPPVKELFDRNRKTDTPYVIEYLRQNPIAGDCALAWYQDVVCTDWNKIVLPIERPL